MSNKWMDVIGNSNESSAVLDIPTWLCRATLDAIGQGETYIDIRSPFPSFPSAAFDVHFGCIDNNENALVRSYTGFM